MRDPAEWNGRFPTTRWSLVEAARGRDEDAAREAFGRFFETYAEPMMVFVLQKFKGMDRTAVEQVIGDFVADEYERRRVMRAVDQERGRFRWFLCQSLWAYVRNRLRHLECRPWDADAMTLDADASALELAGGCDDAVDATDIAWAVALLNHAIQLTKEYCDLKAKPQLWRVFRDRLLADLATGREVVAYPELAQSLGISDQQARLRLEPAKRIFERMVRRAASEYTQPERIDEELLSLWKVAHRAPTGWFSALEVRIP